MSFPRLTITLLAFLFTLASHAQVLRCQTAPMEGYSGTDCNVLTITTPNGKYVYTFSNESKTLKQWDFQTNTVVNEWSISMSIENFIDMSYDSRYLRMMGRADEIWTARLFDTQTGKFITIEKFGVHAVMGNNLAVVEEVNGFRRKMMLYDVSARKAVATLEKEKASIPKFSLDGNIIAWTTSEFQLKVYDVSKRSMVHEAKSSRMDAHVGVSPDGRFVAASGKVTDVTTKKTVTMDFFVRDTRNHYMLFSTDSKKVFAVVSGCVNNPRQCGALVVLEYDPYTGKLLGDYSEKWLRISMTPIYAGEFVMQPDATGENLYVPHKQGVALVSAKDYTQEKQVLSVFGGLGAVGLARQEAKKRETERAAQLTLAATQSLNTLKPDAVIFDNGNSTTLFDYDAENELVLLGDYVEVGIFSIKEGKIVTTYSSKVSRPGVSVKVAGPGGVYTLQPGGNVVARGSDGKTELYSRTSLIREIPGVSARKFITNRYMLAVKDKTFGLYDLEANKMLHTFGQWTENFHYRLSPDRTKMVVISLSEKGHQVFDVLTGKKLLTFDDYFHDITNKYIVRTPWNLQLVDLTTGNGVTPTGWEQSRVMKYSVIRGNYSLSFDDRSGLMQVYDLDKFHYVTDMAVKLLEQSEDKLYAVFPSSKKVFFLTTTYTVFTSGSREYASAYTVQLETGEIVPYRFHVPHDVSVDRWHEQYRKEEAAANARKAAANAGLDPCMHDLAIKPSRGAQNKDSGKLFWVESYDCRTQKYKITSPVKFYGMDNYHEIVDRWMMERNYFQVNVTVCPQCNGGGTQVNTVTYSNTTVDNYNANVPGGKVVTTKSGSYQQAGNCSVCKGHGLVKVP